MTLGAAKPGAKATQYRQDLHKSVLSRFSTLNKAEKRRIARSTPKVESKRVVKNKK